MVNFQKSIKQLCTPAYLYFIISIIGLIMMMIQNLENNNSYHIGAFSCHVPNTFLIFVLKFIYIIFWTYVLNLICKDGHIGVSWLLVLLPWILLFVIIGLLMINI